MIMEIFFISLKILIESNSRVNISNHHLFSLHQNLSSSTIHLLNTRLIISIDLLIIMITRKLKDSSITSIITYSKRITKIKAIIEDIIAFIEYRIDVNAQVTLMNTENIPETNSLNNLDLIKLKTVIDLLLELQSHKECLQQLDAIFQRNYRELNTDLIEVKDILTTKLSQLLERFDTMNSQRT